MPLRSCSSVIGTACHVSCALPSSLPCPPAPAACHIVGRASPGRTIAAVIRSDGVTAAAEDARHVEDRTVVAPDREVVGVASAIGLVASTV